MNRVKLIKVRVPKYWDVLLKIIAAFVCLYFLYDVFVDVSREYVVRRGNTYTLQEDPASFYLNISKRVVFAAASFYLALWGIVRDEEHTPT